MLWHRMQRPEGLWRCLWRSLSKFVSFSTPCRGLTYDLWLPLPAGNPPHCHPRSLRRAHALTLSRHLAHPHTFRQYVEREHESSWLHPRMGQSDALLLDPAAVESTQFDVVSGVTLPTTGWQCEPTRSHPSSWRQPHNPLPQRSRAVAPPRRRLSLSGVRVTNAFTRTEGRGLTMPLQVCPWTWLTTCPVTFPPPRPRRKGKVAKALEWFLALCEVPRVCRRLQDWLQTPPFRRQSEELGRRSQSLPRGLGRNHGGFRTSMFVLEVSRPIHVVQPSRVRRLSTRAR